jgi:hypothetical protein
MIALWLISATVLQTVIAPPADEIVVLGRKLASTEGEITTNVITGKHRCTVEKTSGDVRVDKAVCDIAIACLKARKGGPAFKPCVLEGRERFLAQLSKSYEDVAQ